jgi:hypothetical protein
MQRFPTEARGSVRGCVVTGTNGNSPNPLWRLHVDMVKRSIADQFCRLVDKAIVIAQIKLDNTQICSYFVR